MLQVLKLFDCVSFAHLFVIVTVVFRDVNLHFTQVSHVSKCTYIHVVLCLSKIIEVGHSEFYKIILFDLTCSTWDRIPEGIIDETSGKHDCVHV